MTYSSKSWTEQLAPYKGADNRRAIVELTLTILPLISFWISAWLLLPLNGVMAAVCVAGAALFTVRLFMVQHDCGHGVMFSSRKANDWTGRVIGVFTLTPYDYWREAHAQHHAGSGNLDRRGVGDIDTLTVAEYLRLGRIGRLKYRLYRHPLVMFALGPIYLFVFRHRLPPGAFDAKLRPLKSIMATNLGIVVLAVALAYVFGLPALLFIELPMVILAAALGVWLFFVQHQFEHTYWERDGVWTHRDGALQGSSFYDLPGPLMWLTGNIGIHHVHHLASRIPYYRLPKVLSDFPELKNIGRIGFRESLACVKLTLWDEDRKLLIPFSDGRLRRASAS